MKRNIGQIDKSGKNWTEDNQSMIADGIAPRKTKFETEKEYLRNIIDSAVSHSGSVEEFQQELLSKCTIQLKISWERYSYFHPNQTKPIADRNLGTHYEKDYLLERFAENIKTQTKENQQTNQDDIDKKLYLLQNSSQLPDKFPL